MAAAAPFRPAPSSARAQAPTPLFTRAPKPSKWNPRELAGPYEGLTLREWQVQSMLSPLPTLLYHLLHDWLLEPARPRWLRDAPKLAHFPGLFAESLLWHKELPALRQAIYDEVRACWQTLDAPLTALSGMTRNGLLGARGRRLCQLAEACAYVAEASDAEAEFSRALHDMME